MNGILDRCMVCGQPARKPGGGLCTFHDFQALIALSAERMRERLKLTTVDSQSVHKSSPRSAETAKTAL